MSASSFDLHCRRCPRLAAFLDEVGALHPDYHARPVPPFGSLAPRLLIVGLAPGMHGANATGRPFTGDYAGILLYETLHRFGFSNQPTSGRGDGLLLHGCRITNAVKCLPPGNKPAPAEIRTCNPFLREEIAGLPGSAVILALGHIAHQAVLSALDAKRSDFSFAHGAVHVVQQGRVVIDSYHCSRYNTQTRRLTEEMFHEIFKKICSLLEAEAA